MARGFDTTSNCEALAPAIANAGYDFVCRYYGHDHTKCLMQSEYVSLREKNILTVVVWEDDPKLDSYFSYNRGVADAGNAYNMAIAVGQPVGSAIYFAVDYNVQTPAIDGVVSDYFRGITSKLSSVGAGGLAQYKVGVYGSGAVCSAMQGAGLAQFAWLAKSSGWSDSTTFGQWNIKQGAGARLFGIDVDLDQATDSYGAF